MLHIDVSRCKGCGCCVEVCPKKALSLKEDITSQGGETVEVNAELCIQCGSCYRVCPDYVFEIY